MGDIPAPDRDHCKLAFTVGNAKIGNDTIVINMSDATTCDAAAAGECELYTLGFCYAQQNESKRSNALYKRFAQRLQWKGTSAEVIATMIFTYLKNEASGNIEYIRFNESGDLGSNGDVTKLIDITTILSKLIMDHNNNPENDYNIPTITIYTYTHRSDLFPRGDESFITPDNLIIQGSNYVKNKHKENTRKPFIIDNCFMGIEYTNLNNLIETGDIMELIGNGENQRNIDFEQSETTTIVICPGKCLSCNYCKTKNSKKIILCCYHGDGSELKTATGGTTKSFGKLAAQKRGDDIKDVLNNLLTSGEFLGVDKSILQTLVKTNHYNLNSILGKLLQYATFYRNNAKDKDVPEGTKAYTPPILDPSEVGKIMYKLWNEYIRVLQSRRLQDPQSNKTITLASPKRGLYDGTRMLYDWDDIEEYINKRIKRAISYNMRIANNPEITIVESTNFDFVLNLFTESIKDDLANGTLTNDPQFLSNLALANRLHTNKFFVDPEHVQKIFDENGYDINVINPFEEEETLEAEFENDYENGEMNSMEEPVPPQTQQQQYQQPQQPQQAQQQAQQVYNPLANDTSSIAGKVAQLQNQP